MGHWRFRRSIGPKGLKLNISKTGFSVTSGVPGAHTNVDLSGRRKRPFMSTFGLPGTGLSYRTTSYGPGKSGSRGSTPPSIQWVAFVVGAIVLAIVYLRWGFW